MFCKTTRTAAFLIAVVIVMVGVREVWANPVSGVLARHSGANDPRTEGWTLSTGVPQVTTGPIFDDDGYDAWIVDDYGFGSFDYVAPISESEVADALANGWRWRWRLKVANVPDAVDGGIYINFLTGSGGPYFPIAFGSDSAGDPIVQLGNTIQTLDGVGSGYHLYEARFDPATSEVALSVDGVLALTEDEWPTHAVRQLAFGAGNQPIGEGRWNMLEFEIIPEPGTTALLLCAAITLLGVAWRRKRQAAVLVAVGIVLAGANSTFADIISWHASSGVLPNDPSIPEESRFAITHYPSFVSMQSGFLKVNDTIGNRAVRITQDVDSFAPGPWAFQTELRMNSHNRRTLDFGATTGLFDGQKNASLVIASDRVGFTGDEFTFTFLDGKVHMMDTTDDFHTYRVVNDSGLTNLFVDDFDTPVMTITYSDFAAHTFLKQVRMTGSSSLDGTANFDIRSFAYNLNGTVIPEPSTIALLCAAITLLGLVWKRRPSAKRGG